MELGLGGFWAETGYSGQRWDWGWLGRVKGWNWVWSFGLVEIQLELGKLGLKGLEIVLG